jgi:coenzyme F420-dependent glucose-6-phosphate dehydrogenase
MATIGYHASHEQFRPSVLLSYVQRAEQAGFTAVSSSDHFQPWNQRQGESGFAWAWLGAAMHATFLPFRVVCAPGQRYHPAIIAQAAATLAEMFPARFQLALGSGEALNELVVGGPWPLKAERNARLLECVQIIRALWRGETVTHDGWVKVREAKLYTRAPIPPQILGAAITAETARWVGGWADGLLTLGGDAAAVRATIEAFCAGGGAGKPVYLQAALSYARDAAEARQGAYEQWRTNIFPSDVLADLWSPEQFDAAAAFVRPEDLDDSIRIAADPQAYVDWLQPLLDLDISGLSLHNVNRGQEAFIDTFGERVLPALRQTARRAI